MDAGWSNGLESGYTIPFRSDSDLERAHLVSGGDEQFSFFF